MSTRLPAPQFEQKIVSFDELAERARALPGPVVMTNGVFDILHRGHVTYLAQARSLGGSLIVAVNSDSSVKMLGKGDDRPINTEQDRAAVLAALESVDLVVIFEDKVPLKVIGEARPDIMSRAATTASRIFPKPGSSPPGAQRPSRSRSSTRDPQPHF
jgi:rfaE bifunctional protein nucleotidyltransferase chain/domain